MSICLDVDSWKLSFNTLLICYRGLLYTMISVSRATRLCYFDCFFSSRIEILNRKTKLFVLHFACEVRFTVWEEDTRIESQTKSCLEGVFAFHQFDTSLESFVNILMSDCPVRVFQSHCFVGRSQHITLADMERVDVD